MATNEYIIANKEDIIAIADAIRTQNGTSDGIALTAMDEDIMALSGGISAPPTFKLNV